MLRFTIILLFAISMLTSNAQCPNIGSPQALSVCSGVAFNFAPTNGGGNTVPAGTTYTWTIASNPNVTGEANQATPQTAISQTLTHTSNSPVVLSYTVTPVLATCPTTSFTLVVTVNPVPVVVSSSLNVCSGNSFNVSPTNGAGNVVPTVTNYTWTASNNSNVTGEGNQASSQSSISQTLTNTTNVNQSINYIVTPQSGSCPGSTFTIAVTINPEATISPATATLCSGDSFTVSPTNGSGNIVPAGTNYIWTVAANGNVTGESNQATSQSSISQSLTNTTNFNQIINYTVTPQSGSCQGSTFTIAVTVNPEASIASTSVTICSGNSFNVTPTNGSGNIVPSGTNYTWTAAVSGNVTGEGNQTNPQSIISQILNNTTNFSQTVSYTVIPQSGTCTGASFAIAVAVNAKPAVTLNLQETICSEQQFTFTPQNGINGIVPANTTLTWTVSNSNVNGEINNTAAGVNTISQTLANTNYANNLVVYQVTPIANSCVGDPFNYTVIVNKAPNLIVTSAYTVCQGNSVQLFAIDAFSTGQLLYNWSNSNTLNNGYIFNPIATPISTIVYTVSATDNTTQCQVSRSINVNVSPLPTATITAQGSSNICQGNSVLLNANTGAGLSYQWRMNDVAIPNATSSTYTANSAGIYSLVVTNANGCIKTSLGVTVNVNSLPLADISNLSPTTFCEGDNVILNTTNVAGNTYQWKLNGVNIPNATSSNFNVTASGSYSIIVSNSTTQCTNTSPQLLVSVNALPSAAIAAQGSTNICQGNSVVLNANTGIGLSYQWRLNDVTIPNATSPTYTANSAGFYSLVVTNANGCTKTSSGVVVNVSSLPLADISNLSPTTFCEGDNVILNTTNVAGNTYQWKLNGVSIIGADSYSFEANQTGSYSVIVTNANSCSALSPGIDVFVNPLPEVNISFVDLSLCFGQSTALLATGASTYSWTPAGLVSNSTIANPNVFPTSTTNFGVTGTDQNGCTDYSEIQITVVPNPTLDLPSSIEACQGSMVSLPGSASLAWTGVTSTNDFSAEQSGYAIATLQNSNFCSSTDSIYIQVNLLPLPNISGASSVCANSSYSEYTVNSTGNLFSWNVSNGEFQGVDNGNTAIIHWFDQEYGPSTFVTVTEHDIHSGCEGSDTLFVSFAGLAPSATNVSLLYPNGSTLFSADHYAIMNWGSTIIYNNVDEYTDGHAQYYTFDNFDTALRYYWIEAGDDSLCLTRSYFNAPVWQVGVQETTDNSLIKIYPNPTSGILNLSVDTKNSISSFSIYNGTGHLVKQEFNFKNQSVIDVSDLSSGFYILKANDSTGSNYNQTFVKQ